ncbi:MAG: histidine phosphatase family protein [Blautia sp.]|nr:histidine phosphatase family protein [Blautia sp.]
MKLYIIRHGEPDYEIDSLTEEGWREAEALADRLEKENIDTFYTSPLGRAKDTAKPLLARLGREAEILPFLREFNDHRIWRPDSPGMRMIPWDWVPEDWTAREGFFLEKEWYKDPEMQEADVYGYYKEAIDAFDELLARHGYVREGRIYRVERGSHEKVALFCHLGLECVLLSHLLNCSPMVLWHGLCPLPSSVTTIYTEERRKGSASFRCERIGDLSHLYAAGLTPSFAARFCECYEDDTRH